MDPALAALDFAKAGAIIADMIMCCLAAGAPPFDPEGPDDHDVQNRRSTPVAAGLHQERDREIGAQWRMRIERARYDVDLAERRYEAVDPGNRLIAATLEQRWNEAMQRLHDLEAELACGRWRIPEMSTLANALAFISMSTSA